MASSPTVNVALTHDFSCCVSRAVSRVAILLEDNGSGPDATEEFLMITVISSSRNPRPVYRGALNASVNAPDDGRASVLPTLAAAAPITLVNADFETGDLTGWETFTSGVSGGGVNKQADRTHARS
jgi:hypothetical protein